MGVSIAWTIRYLGLMTAALLASAMLSACGSESSSALHREPGSNPYLVAINEARKHARDCGDTHFQAAPLLRWNAKLAAAAQEHSDDMAENDFVSHEGSDGSTYRERIEKNGYTKWRSLGENVAAGQPNTRKVVQDWLDSPGHCKNIMSPKFTEMGMALSENNASEYQRYWTADFGSR